MNAVLDNFDLVLKAFGYTVFLFLVNSSGAIALFVYVLIACSQLRMRRRLEREAPERLKLRMWLFPYLTWAAAAVIVFVLGYMLTDTEHDGRTTVLLSLLVAALVIIVAVVKQKVTAQRAVAGKS